MKQTEDKELVRDMMWVYATSAVDNIRTPSKCLSWYYRELVRIDSYTEVGTDRYTEKQELTRAFNLALANHLDGYIQGRVDAMTELGYSLKSIIERNTNLYPEDLPHETAILIRAYYYSRRSNVSHYDWI